MILGIGDSVGGRDFAIGQLRFASKLIAGTPTIVAPNDLIGRMSVEDLLATKAAYTAIVQELRCAPDKGWVAKTAKRLDNLIEMRSRSTQSPSEVYLPSTPPV